MKKKFKRAILHFGADKTGSTAIQAALSAFRQVLLDKRLVAYPPGQWHAQLGSVFCATPAGYIYNSLRGVGDENRLHREDQLYLMELNKWIEAAPRCESIVFSYEGFCSLDKDALCGFRTFCEEIADEVMVVLYARPPLSYAISAMSQRVKQGFNSWPANDPPLFPYKHYFKNILSVFGKENVQVRKFTPDSLKNGDVVADFMGLLNLSDALVNELVMYQKITNESLSLIGLGVGEILINTLFSRGISFNHEQFHIEIGQYLGSIPGEKIQLSAIQLAELLEATSPHTKFLESQFGLSFNEDISKYSSLNIEKTSGKSGLMLSLESILADMEKNSLHHKADFVAPEFILVESGLVGPKIISSGQSACFEIEFALAVPVDDFEAGIQIWDKDGNCAFGTSTRSMGCLIARVECGTHRLRVFVVADLPHGQYSAGFTLDARCETKVKKLASYKKLFAFEVAEIQKNMYFGYVNLPCEFDYQQTSDQVPGMAENMVGTLIVDSMLGTVAVGESLLLQARLCNYSSQRWLSRPLNTILLSYHWLDMAGNVVVFEGERTQLPSAEVIPGHELAVQLRMLAPQLSGRYKLQMMPISDGLFWFDEMGFTPSELEVDVVNLNEPRRYPGADVRLFSQTGVRDGGVLVCGSKAGFLMFGPYAQLPVGNYSARVEGVCDAVAKGMWCDVVRDKGAQVLARQEVGDVVNAGVIVELPFKVDELVCDLEVRFWCPADAQVRIEALCIEPNESGEQGLHLD